MSLVIDGGVPSLDRIRLICMGRGILGPATSTLEENEVPVFLTHPTPVNVSVKPIMIANQKKSSSSKSGSVPSSSNNLGRREPPAGDCCCIIS